MTADALLVLQTLFGSIWSIFTSWHIPGTAVTLAAFFLFLLFSAFVIRFIKSLFSGTDEK